ncbi:MAG: hypothetical protein ACFCUR_06535 [Rhodomicrobiaceae bacterium]
MSNNDYYRGEADKEQVTVPEKRAKQGGFRRVTLWIMIVSLILATIVGYGLLSTTEEYTADEPAPLESAPENQAPPIVPGESTN